MGVRYRVLLWCREFCKDVGRLGVGDFGIIGVVDVVVVMIGNK